MARNDRPQPGQPGGGGYDPPPADGQQYGQAQGYPPPGPPQGYAGGAVPPGPPVKRPGKPFYKRWYVWVGVIVVIGIIASAAGGSGKKKDNGDGSPPVTSGAVVAPSSASAAASSANSAAASTSKSKSSGISKGLGTKDASADVKISSKVAYSEDSGTMLTLTVTNHSSKRSDYIIDVALETADGSQQLDDSPALAQNLDPGQSTKVEVDFLNYISKAPPASAVVKLKSIQRNPSL